MTRIKDAILCVILLLTVLPLSACEKELRDGVGVSAQLPMELVLVEGRSYSEIDQETIQRLNLSVESCKGLTEVGKIHNAGSKVNRVVYDKPISEYMGVAREPVENLVTVPETAYAHPDPRYPNLIVALVDGEPAIFEFANLLGRGYYHPEEGDRITPGDLVAIYGLTSPEAIREIQVYGQENKQDDVLKATVSDPGEIQQFLDAIRDLDNWGLPLGSSDPDDDFPWYYVHVDLANEFSFDLRFTPKTNSIAWANFWFPSNEALNTWIKSQVKQSK